MIDGINYQDEMCRRMMNPKHILYNGNLYELVDTDIISVADTTVEILNSKLKQLNEQNTL